MDLTKTKDYGTVAPYRKSKAMHMKADCLRVQFKRMSDYG